MVRSRLLGIDIDSLTQEEFLLRIDAFIHSKRPHQVSYLNADSVNKCWSNRSYRQAVAASDLVYADGMSIVWASRLFGHPLPERVNANDLFPDFCERASQQGYRIFLLGGEEGVAQTMADAMQAQFPQLNIVGTQHGYFSDDDEASVIDTIRNANPDILIVGMGAPRQELWIHHHLKTLEVPVAWGVGGLFDYTAKNIARAPVWMRQWGLEWVWRFAMEPRRMWKRYLLGNLVFTFRVGFLIFTDAILASLAWMLAYFIRAEIIPQMAFLPEKLRVPLNPFENYLYSLPIIIGIWILICASLDLYRRQFQRTTLDEFTALIKMIFLFLISSMAVAFLLKGFDLGRAVLLLSSSLMFLFMLSSRMLWNRLEKSMFEEGIGRVRVLLVGAGDYARSLLQKLYNHPHKKYEIIGILADSLPAGDKFEDHPVLGSKQEIADWAKTLDVDEIFFTNPNMEKRDVLNLVATCREQTSVRQYNLLSEMFGMITDGAAFEDMEDVSFRILRNNGLSPFEQSVKRIMDISIASVLLLVALPLFPVIVLAIRLSSNGPAIFCQERIGKGGNPFTMYKFRTMYRNVNEYQEAPITKNDSRVLPVGRWLRRTSLDELPQLWNVVKGEMSMVGPRPEMQFIVDGYEPWQRSRLSVLPGITGLWQISGRKDLPLNSNLEYDFYYIQHQSLLFDISILLKTIPVVLFGKGAY